MSRQFNRHQFAYPSGIDRSEPRLGYRDIDAEGGVSALLHPAVKAMMTPQVGVAPRAGFDARYAQLDSEMMRPMPGVQPPDYQNFADADDIAASRAGGSFMDQMRAGGMGYDHGGPAGATLASPITDRAQVVLDRDRARRERIAAVPDYQRKGQAGLQGYASNPLEEAGRNRIANQFWEAPLGGHVRGALEGQEVFGHKITGDQARMTEQGLAGLTAVGIGVPAFMAAVQQLSTPADQNTIPF